MQEDEEEKLKQDAEANKLGWLCALVGSAVRQSVREQKAKFLKVVEKYETRTSLVPSVYIDYVKSGFSQIKLYSTTSGVQKPHLFGRDRRKDLRL